MSGKIYPVLEENFETLFLYWLDAEVNKSDYNQSVQKQLRSIVKHLHIFDDQNQCRTMIESYDRQDRLILIVSGRIGREIVPEIHQIRQLSSIYIFCQDKASHEQWAKHFFKVREVIVDVNQLITVIQLAHRSRVKIELSISYNIYSIIDNHDTSLHMLNKNFLQSLMLINMLLRLESPSHVDQQEFLSICKKDNKHQKTQLNILEEFTNTYKSDKVLWWYTRNSFFYRTIDRILRSTAEYFEQFLLCHSYIHDIYSQLKQHQYQSSIRVYFGQLMWLGEIEYLKNDRSKYLAINTFWLTNINREKVIDLLNHSERSGNEHQALFIIDADPNIGSNKPFADISKCCDFDQPGEILFMIGSIFRIIEVQSEGAIWMVRLELCGENEQFEKSLHRIDGVANVDLRTFADILYRIEQYNLAERTYQQLLAKLPSNDSICPDLYFSLAVIAKGKKEYDSSLKFYEKALKSKVRINPSDFLTIGKYHACIGEIHRLKLNDKEALKSFEKAIEIYIKEHAEYHQHMADFYDNISSIYRRLKKYDQALDYSQKALVVDEKQSSSNSLGIGKSQNNIGMIYCLLKQYDLALSHYQNSLQIKLEGLPSPHLSIANSYTNIASVHKTTGDLEKALVYYQKAATIYQQLLSPQDSDVIQTDNEIKSITHRLR